MIVPLSTTRKITFFSEFNIISLITFFPPQFPPSQFPLTKHVWNKIYSKCCQTIDHVFCKYKLFLSHVKPKTKSTQINPDWSIYDITYKSVLCFLKKTKLKIIETNRF